MGHIGRHFGMLGLEAGVGGGYVALTSWYRPGELYCMSVMRRVLNRGARVLV